MRLLGKALTFVVSAHKCLDEPHTRDIFL